MKRLPSAVAFATLVVTLTSSSPSAQSPRPSVYQTTLEEPNQKTPEITTEELLAILATHSEPVFDVRTAKEYAIAHIPGTTNVYEKEVERITELYPDRSTRMTLYCNGPSCGKSKRTSEQLVAFGYTNVRRYQLGLPVWRALSQTVQTDMAGFASIFSGDRTAVFVDARTPAEFATATVPGAVSIRAGEATTANDDGRLPFQDKGTRIVVFGETAEQARVVAAEIAKKAYWNSSYLGGTVADLAVAGYINHPPVAITRSVTVAAGPRCTVTIAPTDVDAGSFDADSNDSITLAVEPAGPLGLGVHAVTLTATDLHGAQSTSASVVNVTDQAAPLITGLSIDKAQLWPPDHRMEPITVSYEATDNCGSVGAELVVTSSEGGTGDWLVIDAHHLSLRAERAGGDDRTYSITVVATDGAGNQSASALAVRVPSSMR
jgi:rhodanese-related sulfurtransferase